LLRAGYSEFAAYRARARARARMHTIERTRTRVDTDARRCTQNSGWPFISVGSIYFRSLATRARYRPSLLIVRLGSPNSFVEFLPSAIRFNNFQSSIIQSRDSHDPRSLYLSLSLSTANKARIASQGIFAGIFIAKRRAFSVSHLVRDSCIQQATRAKATTSRLD